ncbi:hypothetical protein HW115_00935 [Verrucomicrobiaceae bacterium N1E253]|uniref:Uncharacterized protein n=1 Tax=Oceaniferula marina TaxID=2748318 RepID=A0A851GAC3_9BACT|nr:hypothetical protein [Oceaniferula marina]NWK54159.1 hypothetical protein [Oceaniferula marina]
MGFICLSFPWLFQSVLAVQILACSAVILLLVIRLSNLRNSVGSALFSVERLSIGELLFPAAVAWLFTLSWDQPVLYCISLLLLTLADSAGALAGSKLGKQYYQTAGASKTLEGSIAFFITAALCTALPLYTLTHLPIAQVILLALNIALFTTAVEGASGHGIDNLLIPIGAFLLLDYYTGLSGHQLLIRSTALMILLAVLLATHHKHTLNGGAILTALLYSFAAFTLGGIPCLLATILLFIRHIIVQHRLTREQVFVHSIDVILAISIPSLAWLTLGRGQSLGYTESQFGFICTLAIIIYMLNTGTQKHLHQKRPNMWPGMFLTVLVLTPSLFIKVPMQHYLPVLLIAPVLAWLYFHWREPTGQATIYHWIKLSLLAAIGSIANMLITLVILS